MTSTFKSSKKCPQCGQWSEWQQQPTDTCAHCGALLDDRILLREAAREAEAKTKNKFELKVIAINPTDSFLVKVGKRIIQAIQISFIAIVSFIIWFLTMLAG